MPRTAFFVLGLAGVLAPAGGGSAEHFEPAHRLRGIGAERAELTDDAIARRTRRMVESQTFVILRDPRAVAGAQRIRAVSLQRIFNRAERASGVPAALIAAMAYVESFGNARAQSPTGPRGIMQISSGTARSIGLKIVYAKRYRTVTRTRRVRNSQGKLVSRRVRVRVPYSVLVRDDRMVPARAIPAAARYLARLSEKLGGLDWAVFAYHCGESCAAMMRKLTEDADGIGPPYTVAKMFFGGSPAANRDLYLAVQRAMKRDYSPTYWFRVARARELLALNRKDPAGFRKLAATFRYAADPKRRAPHRLALWLGRDESSGSGETGSGPDPIKALHDPDYYGFRILAGRDADAGEGSSSALGTLAYIAFETRRLHEAMNVEETFAPLEASFKPVSLEARGGEADANSSGHVFDIDCGDLPAGEREALEFVLDELGWEGHLGFFRAAPGSGLLHIGASPASRGFFHKVFADALDRPVAGKQTAGRPSM